MPYPGLKVDRSLLQKVITLYDLDFQTHDALGDWYDEVEHMVNRVLTGSPAAWRSSRGTQVWQPFGESTLARIIQQLSVDDVLWVEIQTPDHSIVRYGPGFAIRERIVSACFYKALSQTNPRKVITVRENSRIRRNTPHIEIDQ